MKTVILAGGLGSRLGEETAVRPKPMVEIGGRPIIWHIMKIYSAHGLNDFIICLGYKGYMIKEYFSNYFLHMSDVTIDIAGNSMEVHQNSGRTVAGHAGRYRRGHPDRRAAEGGGPVSGGRRAVLLHLWRRAGGDRRGGLDRFPQGARAAGHGHRGVAAGAVRGPGD